MLASRLIAFVPQMLHHHLQTELWCAVMAVSNLLQLEAPLCTNIHNPANQCPHASFVRSRKPVCAWMAAALQLMKLANNQGKLAGRWEGRHFNTPRKFEKDFAEAGKAMFDPATGDLDVAIALKMLEHRGCRMSHMCPVTEAHQAPSAPVRVLLHWTKESALAADKHFTALISVDSRLVHLDSLQFGRHDLFCNWEQCVDTLRNLIPNPVDLHLYFMETDV